MHPQAQTTKIDTEGKDTVPFEQSTRTSSQLTLILLYRANIRTARKQKKQKMEDKNPAIYTSFKIAQKEKKKKEKAKAKRPTNAFFPQI